jgi:hypothetical protein
MDSPRSISHADWLIGLLLSCLEVTVLTPLTIIVATTAYGTNAPRVPAIGFAAILLGTYVVASLLFARAIPLPTARLISLAVGLLLTFGVVRLTIYRGSGLFSFAWPGDLGHDLWHLRAGISPALTGLFFCLACWWLGVNLASESFTTERTLTIVRLALIGFIAAFVMSGAAPTVPAARDALAAAVPLAFVFALLALSLARLEMVRHDASVRTGNPPPRAPWIGMTLVVTGFLLVLALVARQLLGLGFLGTLVADATIITDLLDKVLYLILLVISYVGFFLLRPLTWLLHRAAGRQPPQQPDRNQSPLDRLQQPTGGGGPGWIVLSLNGLLIVALVLGILWLLYRALRRYRTLHRTVEVTEERESIWSKELLLAGVRRPWARWGKRAVAPTRPRRLDTSGQSVRAVYAQVCAAVAEHGLPRHSAETPSEYAVRLCVAWPDAEGYWTVLTETYRRVRYGGIAPSAGEWRAVEAGWQQLRQRWAEGTLASAPANASVVVQRGS